MSKEDLIEVLNIFDKLVDNNYGYYDGIDVEEQTNIIYDETIRCFNEKHQSTDCKELDKAAENYVDEECSSCDYIGAVAAEKAFKAGAKWQAQQSPDLSPIDLDGEITKYWKDISSLCGPVGKEITRFDFDDVCRYFYELGKKSK